MYKTITVPSYKCSQLIEVVKCIMQLIIESGNIHTFSDDLFDYFFVDKPYLYEYDIPEYVYVELRRYGFRRYDADGRTTFSLFMNYES